MIKKKFKLKGEDIKNFFKNKYKKISLNNILLLYQKNNLNQPRFAVVLKSNLFKKAVLRNKAKRRIYAIIEELLKKENFKNYDYLIFPQESDYQKLKESLIKIFKKCLSF